MSKVNKTSSRKKKLSAPKAKFSFKRHVLPPLIGITVMALAFVALNSQMLVAQANYHFKKPVVVVSTPVKNPSSVNTKSPDPSAGPQILIPTIGVKAPIIFEQSTAEWAVQLALRRGVNHYGNTVNPGQIGNTVIFGHSSGAVWAPGDYKFVFTLLDKVKAGDQITIDYEGTRYTYVVTGTEIIVPTNLSVLNQNTNKPTLTLITCTPVGTSKYRFVVHADQITPDPAKDKKPAAIPVVKSQPQLPGSAHSSLWSSLFSWL
jgi:sortase A